MRQTVNAILAVLLLCGSLRAEGPLFSIWHVDGHGYQWQQDQIDAGLPLERSIRMVGTVKRNGPNPLLSLNAAAPILSRWDGQNIVLRMNNITSEVDDTIPRIDPLTEENWRQSHLCIRLHPDTGALDDTPIPSPWADPAAWAESGKQWATSLWMKRLQEILPSPTGIILRENNEGPRLKLTDLYVSVYVKATDPKKGTIRWATANDDPSIYIRPDAPADAVWTYFLFNNRPRAIRWRTKAECDGIDLRAWAWVEPRVNDTPTNHEQAFLQLDVPLYKALYAAFDANLSPGWRGKLRTVGYGGPEENVPNDASSSTLYMAVYRPAQLTDPAHQEEWLRRNTEWSLQFADHPQAWRELSVRMRGPTLFQGALDGVHGIVDPESYSAYMTYGMWVMQHPGREVRLTYYESYLTKPTDLFFDPNATGWEEAVVSLGREDLLTLTVNDWEQALMQRMLKIHSHPIINRYWREGTTVVLDSPLNDAVLHRVYATETSIPGSTATLLTVYTPCDLTGEIQVGEWTVPAKRFAYYLTGGIQEIE